jgi:SAM-dependent methyltransferase
MTVAEWDRDQPTFDVAWSISSFEHDGLGMYGDPLDPDGDLKAMQKMKRIVKPGGLMFFAVPVGKDKILYNLCRIYGEVRLKKMFEGWEVLDQVGFHPTHLIGPGHVHPVFILKNT